MEMWKNLGIKCGFYRFIRNLKGQLTVGILSMLSLTIGVVVVLLVGLWVIEEFSFDRFHKDGEQIYRVYSEVDMNGERVKIGSTYKPLGKDAMQHFPEVEDMCRVIIMKLDIKRNETTYPGNPVLEVDPNFFQFFTFGLKDGDPSTCLTAPDGVVISESLASECFPGENPIGNHISIRGDEFTVTAIMHDMPENSHLKARIVTPFIGGARKELEYGDWDNFVTYLKIAEPGKISDIESGLTGIIQEFQVFKQMNMVYKLQHLYNIHFDNTLRFDSVKTGSKNLIMAFLLVAFLVLLIACVNFINLFISTSFLRAKEIGVKKTFGAERSVLIREFFQETGYYVFASLLLGILSAVIALPVFNSFTGYHLEIDFTDPVLYLLLVALGLIIMLLAATFPAIHMTCFNATAILKGQFKGKKLSVLQRGMIIMQFATSIAILISVCFIRKQVDFMLSKDLGFDKENVICVYQQGGVAGSYEALRNEMKSYPAIVDVTRQEGLPTDWTQGNVVQKRIGDDQLLMEFCRIEPNYFDVMKIKVIQGKGFEENKEQERNRCLLNETAVQSLGLSDPVGNNLYINGETFDIIGVVKDAQTKSLHHKVDPQLYLKLGKQERGVVFFKIQGNPQEAIRLIEDKWKSLNPAAPFKYYFLSDRYAQLYTAETRASMILGIVMGITLLISIIGLFAMAFYTTQRRLKEVGIRKVNGASLISLLWKLNKSFLSWIGIAFAIACPVAYYLVHLWLEGFAERTPLSWWVFGLVWIISCLITLLTVSYQTWKAARVNPIKILHLE